MQEIFFNTPAGTIHGKYSRSFTKDPSAPAALILHPHYSYGEDMENPVICQVFKAFEINGFNTLKINYKIEELLTAAGALDWLEDNNVSTKEFWIAGFDFGAWIGMELAMRRPEITRFISIAPPVNRYDFSFLSPCPLSGLVIQGDQDSILPEEDVLNFVETVSKNKQIEVEYQVISQADHFFREKSKQVGRTVHHYIKSVFNQPQQNESIKAKK